MAALARRDLNPLTHPDTSEIFSHTPFQDPCTRPGCAFVSGLRWIQSAMLVEAAQQNGGFFPVGVGHGKTLASMLLPEAMGSQRAVLLVPPSMKAQLLRYDLPHLRQHFRVPTLVESDGTRHHGAAGVPGTVYVVAYSEISSPRGRCVLDDIAPDLIVCDEAHYLRHRDAARTRRFMRFMRANPGTRFVCMSGTLTDSSIRDYAHLIDLALGKNSPLPAPAHFRELNAWAEAVDVGGMGGAGALAMFAAEGETIREGYGRRLRDTPGVVGTTGSPYQGSLVIRKRAPRTAPAVQKALDTLASTWAWDGVEHESALAVFRVARQISAGFFYRLKWPGAPDLEWLAARNAWNRVRRNYLTHNNRPGMDSEGLLEAAAERGDWTPPEWFAWLPHRDKPEPGKEAVWISDYLVQDAATWARMHKTGIIWTLDPCVGEAIAKELGVDYFGEDTDEALAVATPETHPILVASIRCHGTGKNLQAWSRSLVVSPPASGSGWEQLIGRTHRQGQLSDEVEIHVNLHTAAYLGAWLNAREKAAYTHQTMRQEQKLVIAKVLEE